MAHLIDKDALVAEIEKRINEINESGTYLSPKGTLTNLLCHLNNVEIKEVDLDKELPKKYETPDWLWVYGNIGLTEEHIKRLNNAINLLESLNEHTDARYLKEIKDKLLAVAPMTRRKLFKVLKK